MRVKGKHIITNVGAPTKVSDMKEGEMRSDATSLYGRVGNQILHKDWVAQELSTVKCTGAVDDDDFATISFPWSENDANSIAAPGVNGYENFGLANGEAWVGWAAETTAGQYDVCLYVDIFEIPSGIGANTFFRLRKQLGNDWSVYMESNAQGNLQFRVTGDGYTEHSWGNFGIGSYAIRYTRDASNYNHLWIYDPLLKIWHWNYDTNGLTNTQASGINHGLIFYWKNGNVGASNYLKGAVALFAFNAGFYGGVA